MFTKDTTRIKLTNLNFVEEEELVAAIAKIPARIDNFYSRLKFECSYQNILTLEAEVKTFEDHFSLYSCSLGVCSSLDTVSLPVGTTPQNGWLFLNRNLPECLVALDTLYPTNPGECFYPCCFQLEKDEWKATFKITMESMTFPAFQYWENIQRLISNDGILLDTYPFPIKGNVYCDGCNNQVIGLFRASSESYATETRWF